MHCTELTLDIPCFLCLLPDSLHAILLYLPAHVCTLTHTHTCSHTLTFLLCPVFHSPSGLQGPVKIFYLLQSHAFLPLTSLSSPLCLPLPWLQYCITLFKKKKKKEYFLALGLVVLGCEWVQWSLCYFVATVEFLFG